MTRFAIDCEMVGARSGKNLLARVSVVDLAGSCVYDEYVKPQEPVHDYRTSKSGITASHLADAKSFNQVKNDVKRIISDQILVGHSVDVDLDALDLTHPEHLIRDVAKYPRFKQHNSGKTPSLCDLAAKELGMTIQEGPHSSVEDAKAAMKLYNKVAASWQ